MAGELNRIKPTVSPVDRIHETKERDAKKKGQQPFNLEEEAQKKEKPEQDNTTAEAPAQDVDVAPPGEDESGTGLNVVA